jgi:hypothetical protein
MGAGRHKQSRKLGVLAGGLVAVVTIMGLSPAVSSSRNPLATVTQSHCYVKEVPCLGVVQALYTFTGKAGGALRSIHAKLGPEEETGNTPEGMPIMRRSVTWKSVASVRLVVAYVLTIVAEHWRIHRVPTGVHSGHATLTTEPQNPEPVPYLLLEGRKSG